MSSTFRLLALHTLYNGVNDFNWAMMEPLLLEQGHQDIVDAVTYTKDRYRITRDDIQTLIGLKHD